MAANWNSYVSRRKMRLEDIRRTIDLLHKSGVRVVLIGQSPVFTFVYPDEYFFQVYGSQSTDHPYEGELAVDPGINEKISAISKADVFFDALAPLCDSDQCIFKDHGLYLFSDYGHFTPAGSIRMVAAVLTRLDSGLSKNQPKE
jgi:SGNH domain-containing protein